MGPRGMAGILHDLTGSIILDLIRETNTMVFLKENY